MSKSSYAAHALPPIALASLRRLGENIAIARSRRKESQRVWAQRIGISIPTLIRVEKGDPTVSMGAYAGALWLMSRVQALADLAAPEADLGALAADVRKALRRHSRRRAPAIEARQDVPGDRVDPMRNDK